MLGIETKASSHSPHIRQRMKIAPKNTTNHSLKYYPQVLTSLFSLFKLFSRKRKGTSIRASYLFSLSMADI
jgi:hypothetical protein